MKIAFIYHPGRLRRFNDLEKGIGPSEFFLGAHQIKQQGHHVSFFEVDEAESFPFEFLVNRLRRRGLWPVRASGVLVRALWKLSGNLSRFDVLVATTTGIAFALGICKICGRSLPPIIAIHCGILHYKHNGVRRRLTSRLLGKMWTQLYGDGEFNEMKMQFSISPERIMVNQFGVDIDFWNPGNETAGVDYILAVGNDGRRDYDTLVRAARKVDCHFIIITNQSCSEIIPSNVEILRGDWHNPIITDLELREYYRKAMCIVVPLIDSYQPSGQSVALQAMACGKPVIITRTRGLWAPQLMKDGENILFVDPAKEDELAKCVHKLTDDKKLRKTLGYNARETVEKYFNIDDFAGRLMNYCEHVVKMSLSG